MPIGGGLPEIRCNYLKMCSLATFSSATVTTSQALGWVLGSPGQTRLNPTIASTTQSHLVMWGFIQTWSHTSAFLQQRAVRTDGSMASVLFCQMHRKKTGGKSVVVHGDPL